MIIRRLTASGMGVASQVLGNVAFFILLARMWEPIQFGHFVYLYSLTTLLVLIVDYGYPQRVLRDVPRQGFRNRINLVNGFSFKVLAALAVLMLAIGQNSFGEDPAIVIVTLALIAGSFADYFGSHLRALGQHRADSVNLLLSNLLLLVPLTALTFSVSTLLSVLGVSLILLLAKVFYLGLSYVGAVKAIGMRVWRPRLRIKALKQEILNGFSYALDVYVVRSYGVLDTILLKMFAGDLAVGLYQSGQRMLQGFLPFAQVANNVFVPMLSACQGRIFRFHATQLILICLLAGAGCAVFFWYFGEFVVKYVFGERYSGIYPYLWLFGILGFLRFAAASLAIILISMGRQAFRVRSNLISILMMIGCAVILIPTYGLSGVVFSLIISSVSVLLFYVYGIYQSLREDSRWW